VNGLVGNLKRWLRNVLMNLISIKKDKGIKRRLITRRPYDTLN